MLYGSEREILKSHFETPNPEQLSDHLRRGGPPVQMQRLLTGTGLAMARGMKKNLVLLLSMLLLTACETFETRPTIVGGFANCPANTVSLGTGLCRPNSNVSQDEVTAAQQRLAYQAQTSTDPRSRAEAEAMIQQIGDANKAAAASGLTNSNTNGSYNNAPAASQPSAQNLFSQSSQGVSNRQDVTEPGFAAFVGSH